MSLPFTDPSLPSAPAPIFGDIDAARGDHLRANNSLIWSNLNYLEAKIVNVIAPVGTERLLITQSDSSASVIRITNSTTTTAASRGIEFGINASEQGRIWNYENTDLVIGTNNTDRGRFTAGGGLAIGTTAVKGTAGKVHILYGTANADTNWLTYAPLVIESDVSTAINIRTPNNANGRIVFSDPDLDLSGAIGYVHTTDYMFFTTSGSARMRLNATGLYVGGSADPSNPLHVQSTTTPQVRIAYDAGSYATIGVADGGNLSITCGEATGYITVNPGAGLYFIVGNGAGISLTNQIIYYSSDSLEYGTIQHNGSNLVIGTGGTNAGNVVISNTTEATSSTAAALISSGGLAVAKKAYIGTDLNVGGNYLGNPNIEGYIKTGKGRWPTGTYEANSTTSGNLYSQFNALLPNVNDEIKVTGSFSVSSSAIYVINRAKRTAPSIIVFYCGYLSTITPSTAKDTFSTTSGGTTAISWISISW